MFSAFLAKNPLESLTLRPDRVSFPPEGDPAWARLSGEGLKAVRALDARYAGEPYPMRRATDFLAFTRNGSRVSDEGPYFTRRKKLCSALLSCCTGTDRLDDVIDGIWCICEETSWVISAHCVNPIPGAPSPREVPLPDPEGTYVDLFAAQTGMILSIVSSVLGEELDAVTPLLRRRIRREIGRRVLAPFLERDDFWWMGLRRTDLNNWTPWIVSNVLYCACLMPAPEKDFLRAVRKAVEILDRYLAVIPPDGGCDEGPGYWNMAGGALLDCLEILEKVSGGALTFWEDEKLRRIMAYPLKTAIGGGWFANFADCDARPFLSPERLVFAGDRTGDPALKALGRSLPGGPEEEISDVPHLSRLLKRLFAKEDGAPEPPPQGDVWLEDIQWRIVRRGGWTLACKAGHNGENHNHNDVGSFMLYAEGRPVVVDAGNMTYTAATFSSGRYSLWNVRSAYHCVPLIGETEQAAGAGFAASGVRCLPDGLEMDIKGAYPEEAGLIKCERTLRLAEKRLTVEDTVVLREEKPVSWVLMLREEPRIDGAAAVSGPAAFCLPEGCAVRAEEIPVTDPRMARSFPGSLWRLAVTLPPARLFRWKLIIRPAENGHEGVD